MITNTKSLTLGQEVAIGTSGSYETRYSFDWTVVRITPSGQVVVSKADQERRFNARGYEMGRGDTWRTPFLVEDVARVRDQQARAARARAAAAALNEVSQLERVRDTYSKEFMLEQVAALEALVAKARAAVEAI